jgi:hypothetical protein
LENYYASTASTCATSTAIEYTTANAIATANAAVSLNYCATNKRARTAVSNTSARATIAWTARTYSYNTD